MTENFVISNEKLREIGEDLLKNYVYTSEDVYTEAGERDGLPYNYIDFMDMHKGNVNTLELTEIGYKKFEEICESPKYNQTYDNFRIDVLYDVSGYHYWCVIQREPNYVSLTITLKGNLTQADKELIREISRQLSCDLADIRGSEYVLSDDLYQKRIDGEYDE